MVGSGGTKRGRSGWGGVDEEHGRMRTRPRPIQLRLQLPHIPVIRSPRRSGSCVSVGVAAAASTAAAAPEVAAAGDDAEDASMRAAPEKRAAHNEARTKKRKFSIRKSKTPSSAMDYCQSAPVRRRPRRRRS